MPMLVLRSTFRSLVGARRWWASASVAMVVWAGGAIAGPKDDEHVVLFPTAGWFDADQQRWIVPVHGWVYEPEANSLKRAAARKLLSARLDITAEESTLFRERADLFMADNQRGKRFTVSAGQLQNQTTTTCAPSEPNGHFEGELSLGPSAADHASAGPGSTVEVKLATRPDDDRAITGRCQLIPPRGVSIITDVDDTIKVSEVWNRKALVRKTLAEQFEPVAGMAHVLSQLANDGAAVHYLSASPWQLSAPLTQMLSAGGFPAGSLRLKSVRLKDESALDLFMESGKFKLPILRELMQRYPQRRFILIGDAGEEDPEVYAQIAREFPAQIGAIVIRIPKPKLRDEARFARAFEGLSCATVVFEDAKELSPGAIMRACSIP